MAEKDSGQQSQRWQKGGRNSGGSGGSGNSRVSGRQAVREAREQLFELIGRPVEQVLGVQRGDDGDWEVLVQVVELERIPNSTDVLGAYQVTLDEDGEVVGYRRLRRFVRSQADED
jgi:Gas vesicle synthesis protein GvpO